MNPKILFPDWELRPWTYIAWKEEFLRYQPQVICDCHVQIHHLKAKKLPRTTPTLNFTVYTLQAVGAYATLVIASACGSCGRIHWTSDNLPELIRFCEHKEVGEL